MASLILIVEDEPDLLDMVEYNLRGDGHHTRRATTGARALEQARAAPVPDLVLLDLMLPDMSGLDVCRALRAHDTTRHLPVLMVTARGEEIDRVVGFEVGADDYLVKPFSMRELQLRVRAILRRSSKPSESTAEKLRCRRLRLDPGAHRCFVDEQEVHLTALEFRLLQTMLERRGRVQTREMLLTDVWDMNAAVTTRTVDTHVKRLRQKLGPAGRYIETLRGVGYRFVSAPEQRDG